MAPVLLGRQTWLRQASRGVLRWVGLIAALAIVACCASAPQALAFGHVAGSPFATGSGPFSVAFSPSGALLAAARGPVTATLGRDVSTYRARVVGDALTLSNPRQGLLAQFGEQGVQIRSGRARVGLSLVGYGDGSTLAAVRAVAPRAQGNRVVYSHAAGVSEWYANGPHGLEQDFKLSAPPVHHADGALTLALALSGNLHAALSHGAVRFSGASGTVSYGGLVASDATGRRLSARIALVGGSLLIRVDAADARYPLRIDPSFVTIGNGTQKIDGTYLNAQNMANNLVFTSIGVQATSAITIADPIDLSTSPEGTPQYNLNLISPTCNIDNNVNLAALGNLFLTCNTLNLNGLITSDGTALAPSRSVGTATQVNVLSNAASIQQAIDGSNTTAPVTIQVGAGQYAENLTISHALTLSGNDGTMAAGADPSAPLLVGIQAGGGVITVTANNVTIDGLHLNGSVDAGAEPSSLDGIVASGVDGLTVSHNTLDGFSGAAIDTPGSADVTLNANGIIPTLLSTAVSPANPTVVVGADEQLTDTGTYSEGPTADLTTTATWTSSDPAVATVDAAGVANAVGPGTSTISASVGDLTATSELVVIGPPSAQSTSPADGQTYNLNESVATSFSCSEASGGPGIESCSDSNGSSSPGALDTSTAGTFSYTVTATSTDGQTGTASISYTVIGPPTAQITSPANNQTYNLNQVVATSFSCSDALGGPGLSFTTCLDSNGSTSPGALDTSTAGTFSYTVTAMSTDGQSGTASISYTVLGPPSASISKPADNQTYNLNQIVATSFSCSGASGAPGIRSCTDSNGSASPGTLDTSTVGAHTYTVTATSKDGQTGTASISYTVIGPPTAQITSPANTQTYNLNQSVATSFSCMEASGGPGMSSCLDSNGASSPGALDTSTAGTFSYTVTAMSTNGQSGTASISYTVIGPPTASISKPTDSQTYNLNQLVATSFSCSEASGAPGIQSCSDSDGGSSPGALDTSTAGTFTYTVTATSKDGQTGTARISYTVIAPVCAAAPSISMQPSAQTVTAPAAATFTAAGSTPANCAAPTVQWSSEAPGASSFSPISGATSASYTTPATTTAQSGTKYEATFTNAFGSTTTNPATLTVNASGSGPQIDAKVTATGTSTASVSLSTPTAGDLVVAFVAGDGPSGGGQTATVSGGGLSWSLVGRTNTKLGTSEIWSARATGTLSGAAIKASLAKTGHMVSLTVVAYSGASGVGASQGASAGTGAPTASLTTTQAGSWVFAVGNDWDRAIDRTLGPNQTLVSQATDPAGDTYWVQSTTAPTASAGTPVTINDTAPTTDRWNLELIEILGSTTASCAAAPSISMQPSAQTVTAPAAATFTAAGSTPANCAAPTVQWSSEAPGASSFSPISGATSASYTTPATTTAQSGTKYEAAFTNAFGSTTTNPATLTVIAPVCAAAPSISMQPSAQTVTAPAAATFTAAGSTPANCAAPTVQWSSEAPGASSFSPISGATSASYTTPATTTAQSGTKYEATFTNAFGSTTTNPATLTVNASGSGPQIDAKVTATGTSTASVSLSTPTAGDLVVAFVAGDGPSGGGQTATVSGGGLSWSLVGRTNTKLGTSEIWSARATGTLSGAAIKASLAKTGHMVSLTVVAYSGASGVGASQGASAGTGAPTASLTTTQAGSWVFAVGNDWDRAIDRTLGPNQTLVSQATDPAGDTYWVQSTTAPTASAGTPVTINDTAPTTDRWNLELIEIL